ncbi:rho-related protein racE [Eurytemora carolleeae]|uniref:rho-related protein racE n=1 Tax=Eurytemora carolleeae TaxID=1294199 RepID=UPI000C766BF7|nr:rho-related protein racE [Eurytemora carolleeae]|eukprot:XP_023346933.1 rho-related protein racE-like [Eurytemora affinis]
MATGEVVPRIKAILIGDGASGKTSLAAVYKGDGFPANHIPTVIENFFVPKLVGNQDVQLAIWDTAGQEHFDQIRKIVYPGTHVAMVVFRYFKKKNLVLFRD